MRNIIFLHEEFNSFRKTIGYIPASFHCLTKIHFIFRNCNSIFFTVFYIMENFSIFQQCLGGNTSPVQANSTQIILINDDCILSQLGCPDCSHIATRSTAQNSYIKFCHSLFLPWQFGQYIFRTKWLFPVF